MKENDITLMGKGNIYVWNLSTAKKIKTKNKKIKKNQITKTFKGSVKCIKKIEEKSYRKVWQQQCNNNENRNRNKQEKVFNLFALCVCLQIHIPLLKNESFALHWNAACKDHCTNWLGSHKSPDV